MDGGSAMGRGAEQHLAADPQRRQTGQSHPFPNTHAQGEPYGAKYTLSALLTPHDVEEPAFFSPISTPPPGRFVSRPAQR